MIYDMAFNQFVAMTLRLCFWASDDIFLSLHICAFPSSLFCTINMTPLHLLILIIKSSAKWNERCKDSIPSHKLMEGNAYMSDDYFHFVYLHSYTIYTLPKRYLVALLFHILKICYWLTFLTFEDIIFYCTNVSVRQFISNP